jgi:hypothetical protein
MNTLTGILIIGTIIAIGVIGNYLLSNDSKPQHH